MLNAIYEEDFLGFCYGFRPGRGQHDALDALVVGITSKKVNWILDADIEKFFDTVSQQWLIRFLEHRIGDKRIIRLIQKWLKAGVLEDGVVTVSDRGTGQGAVISPLLANIYLHYVFDLWAERWRRREATGDMIIVRYADDIIVGFQHEADARRFWDAMRERLKEFALTLHPDKTRLHRVRPLRGGQTESSAGLANRRPSTSWASPSFAARSRAGKFLVQRKTRRRPHAGKLKEIKEELRRRMHQPIPEQGKWLEQVVHGCFNYHAVPTNSPRTDRVPPPRHRPLAAHASAAQPEGSDDLGADGAAGRRLPPTNRPSFILGPTRASPSDTQGGSRMREFRTYGSVRGARGNARPYRDPGSSTDMARCPLQVCFTSQ